MTTFWKVLAGLFVLGVVLRFWWVILVVLLAWQAVRHRAVIAETVRARVARANCAALGRHGDRCPGWHHELHHYA